MLKLNKCKLREWMNLQFCFHWSSLCWGFRWHLLPFAKHLGLVLSGWCNSLTSKFTFNSRDISIFTHLPDSLVVFMSWFVCTILQLMSRVRTFASWCSCVGWEFYCDEILFRAVSKPLNRFIICSLHCGWMWLGGKVCVRCQNISERHWMLTRIWFTREEFK